MFNWTEFQLILKWFLDDGICSTEQSSNSFLQNVHFNYSTADSSWKIKAVIEMVEKSVYSRNYIVQLYAGTMKEA